MVEAVSGKSHPLLSIQMHARTHNASSSSATAAQVVKAVSGKFHPLFQWFYFDSVESLPDVAELTPETCAPQVRHPPFHPLNPVSHPLPRALRPLGATHPFQ